MLYFPYARIVIRYRNIEKVVVPAEGRLFVVSDLGHREPMSFDYSMTFARMLAPRAVIMEQYHDYCLKKGTLDTCAICCGDASVHHMPPLPCGHRFHRGCIQRWFNTKLSSARPSRPSCPVCRRSMVYECGHVLDMDLIEPNETWHRQELAFNCFRSPTWHPYKASVARTAHIVHKKQGRRHCTSSPPRTVNTMDRMGELPLGWILAWALDRVEMIGSAQDHHHHATYAHHGATWHEHLLGQLGYLRQLARSGHADRYLERFAGAFARLDAARWIVDSCEREEPPSPLGAGRTSGNEAWRDRRRSARAQYQAAFARAQRDLRNFLACEDVLDASRKLGEALDEDSSTARYLPWYWRYRRRSLGLPDEKKKKEKKKDSGGKVFFWETFSLSRRLRSGDIKGRAERRIAGWIWDKVTK